MLQATAGVSVAEALRARAERLEVEAGLARRGALAIWESLAELPDLRAPAELWTAEVFAGPLAHAGRRALDDASAALRSQRRRLAVTAEAAVARARLLEQHADRLRRRAAGL